MRTEARDAEGEGIIYCYFINNATVNLKTILFLFISPWYLIIIIYHRPDNECIRYYQRLSYVITMCSALQWLFCLLAIVYENHLMKMLNTVVMTFSRCLNCSAFFRKLPPFFKQCLECCFFAGVSIKMRRKISVECSLGFVSGQRQPSCWQPFHHFADTIYR